MVFCETKRDADELALSQDIKQETHVIHGDVPQEKREMVLKVGQTFLTSSVQEYTYLINAFAEDISVRSCINRYLLYSLVRCTLLIAVIFLYVGPAFLYPRTWPLL